MPTPREIRIAALAAATHKMSYGASPDEVITDARIYESWIAEASDSWNMYGSNETPETPVWEPPSASADSDNEVIDSGKWYNPLTGKTGTSHIGTGITPDEPTCDNQIMPELGDRENRVS